eukprot:CAMPEP_0178410856 /NCGR_PEP_ID=MMETSP0689_2-20121128/21199_1 /TAXON_ID=160604 /ORGANISM="Amphidinium massartii, Strain CS-259" /LENGTH=358 /DNA_ID=CAMNT_0020032053 /DNA_START=26 /DNA_END=1098 /DNA_ORIENTATION=-
MKSKDVVEDGAGASPPSEVSQKPKAKEKASKLADVATGISTEAPTPEAVNERIDRILSIVNSSSTAEDGSRRGRGKGKDQRGNKKKGATRASDNTKSGAEGQSLGDNSEAGSQSESIAGVRGPSDKNIAEVASGAGGGKKGRGKGAGGRSKGGNQAEVMSLFEPDTKADAEGITADLDETKAENVLPAKSRATLNPDAPIFVPLPRGAAEAEAEEQPEEDVFPEVVPGSGEQEYIGLQCLAEMGDWVVLREPRPRCQPFFWNSSTGEKTWQAPAQMQETGIAKILQKWAEELPKRGTAPSAQAWPQPHRRPPASKPDGMMSEGACGNTGRPAGSGKGGPAQGQWRRAAGSAGGAPPPP